MNVQEAVIPTATYTGMYTSAYSNKVQIDAQLVNRKLDEQT